MPAVRPDVRDEFVRLVDAKRSGLVLPAVAHGWVSAGRGAQAGHLLLDVRRGLRDERPRDVGLGAEGLGLGGVFGVPQVTRQEVLDQYLRAIGVGRLSLAELLQFADDEDQVATVSTVDLGTPEDRRPWPQAHALVCMTETPQPGRVPYVRIVLRGVRQKLYGKDPQDIEKRYSPAKCIGQDVRLIAGNPAPSAICTSHVERANLTMRMSMRRFTRLTNAFSRKVENLAAAVSLHFMYYNFARPHQPLKNPYPRTPAMAAGVADHVWTVTEIVSLLGA